MVTHQIIKLLVLKHGDSSTYQTQTQVQTKVHTPIRIQIRSQIRFCVIFKGFQKFRVLQGAAEYVPDRFRKSR